MRIKNQGCDHCFYHINTFRRGTAAINRALLLLGALLGVGVGRILISFIIQMVVLSGKGAQFQSLRVQRVLNVTTPYVKIITMSS